MEAGKLRHRVTIQQRSTSLGTRGQASTTWTDVKTVWGSVRRLSGRELELAKRLYADATFAIVLRYRAGLTEEHRLKFGSRYFGIGAVDNDEERNRELRLLCAEARN